MGKGSAGSPASVGQLDLPELDYSAPGLDGERYHQRLAELAQESWLARSPLAYVVLDRQSAEFFLRSPATVFPGREIAALFGITTGPLWEQIDANIINTDGDRHHRLRALVGPAFTSRGVERWRPAMRQFLTQAWETVGPAGACDAVDDLARPYASMTITAVLGAPVSDAPRLHAWSSLVQRQFDVAALSTDLVTIEKAVHEVYRYVEDLLAARRAAPTDDLVSALLAAEDGGERLTHRECVNLVVNVLAGGVDTTQSQLAHGLRLFAEHPDQWARVADDPGLVPSAVEEILRFEPITPFTARLCREPVVHRGILFPAGTIVAVCAERANRDAVDGETFDVSASRDRRVFTFGAGPHYCLGANLARAELSEAVAFLAPRLRHLRLNGPPQFGGIEGIYGLAQLPVTWS